MLGHHFNQPHNYKKQCQYKQNENIARKLELYFQAIHKAMIKTFVTTHMNV